MDVISRSWSTWIVGSPMHIWEQKLKGTKNALKEWAKAFYSHPPKRRFKKIKENWK
jgi:hypothetical protein